MAPHRFVGHEIETPLLNAAGALNGTNEEQLIRDVEMLARTAIGAITIGSFTVEPQNGNEIQFSTPTYYYDKPTGTAYNSMGLPNIGIAAAVRLMPEMLARAHDHGKPLITSLSPTLPSMASGTTGEQIIRMVDALSATNVDLIEINTSCPNVITASGSREPTLGHDLNAMRDILEELTTHFSGSDSHKLGMKLPPYISEDQRNIVPELAETLCRSGLFSFIVTANTIPHAIPRDMHGQPVFRIPGDTCGMSGPGTCTVGRDQLIMWRQALDTLQSNIELVSTLGVHDGQELAIRLKLGAVAAGGVTFLWESEDWGKAITDILTEWVETLDT